MTSVGFGGRDLSDGAGAEMKGARREEWTTSVRNAANTAGDDDNDKAMGRTAVAVPDDSPRMRPAAASMRVRSFSTLRCAAAFGAPFAIWKRQCPAAPVNALGARRLESVSTSASRIRRLASLPAIGRLGPSTVRAKSSAGSASESFTVRYKTVKASSARRREVREIARSVRVSRLDLDATLPDRVP